MFQELKSGWASSSTSPNLTAIHVAKNKQHNFSNFFFRQHNIARKKNLNYENFVKPL